MVFIVISVWFFSFIPIFQKKLSQTEEEFLHAQMRIAQADVLNRKVIGGYIDGVCITNPDILFIENLAIEDVDSFICRDSNKDFVLAVEKNGEWYCVDSEGFAGYIGEDSMASTCTS